MPLYHAGSVLVEFLPNKVMIGAEPWEPNRVSLSTIARHVYGPLNYKRYLDVRSYRRWTIFFSIESRFIAVYDSYNCRRFVETISRGFSLVGGNLPTSIINIINNCASRINSHNVSINRPEAPRSTPSYDTSVSRRGFGVEIECFYPSHYQYTIEDNLRRLGVDIRKVSYTHEVMRCWKMTTDASLHAPDGYLSCEIVSPILYGEAGLENLSKLCRALNTLGFVVNRSSGLHVHQSAAHLSSTDIDSVILFYQNNESLFDSIMAPSRRGNNNTYCHSLVGRSLSDIKNDRYFKVNYRAYLKYKTLEFRQHQGSTEYNKISNWVLLTERIINKAPEFRNVRFNNLTDMLNALGLSQLVGYYTLRQEQLS